MRRNTFISKNEFKVIEANLSRGKVGGGESKTRYDVERSASTPSELRGNGNHAETTTRGHKNGPPPQKREYDSKLPRELVIVGQIKSGKNRILITRTGHRYPPKEFKAWRDEVQDNLRKQWKQEPVTVPVRLHCLYWPGDRRTRDVSGMEDAMFHVLVKAGVLKDDGLVYDCLWYRQPMNTKGPKVLITITEWV